MTDWDENARKAAARADGRDKVRQQTRWKLDLACAAIRCVEPEGGARGASGRTGRYRIDVKVKGERGGGWKLMAVGEDPHALLQEAVNTSLVHLDLNWAKNNA